MNEKPNLFQREIPPWVAAAIVVITLVLGTWIIYQQSDLRGARNPKGTPGNVDPYLSGPNSVLKQGGEARKDVARGTPEGPAKAATEAPR